MSIRSFRQLSHVDDLCLQLTRCRNCANPWPDIQELENKPSFRNKFIQCPFERMFAAFVATNSHSNSLGGKRWQSSFFFQCTPNFHFPRRSSTTLMKKKPQFCYMTVINDKASRRHRDGINYNQRMRIWKGHSRNSTSNSR